MLPSTREGSPFFFVRENKGLVPSITWETGVCWAWTAIYLRLALPLTSPLFLGPGSLGLEFLSLRVFSFLALTDCRRSSPALQKFQSTLQPTYLSQLQYLANVLRRDEKHFETRFSPEGLYFLSTVSEVCLLEFHPRSVASRVVPKFSKYVRGKSVMHLSLLLLICHISLFVTSSFYSC